MKTTVHVGKEGNVQYLTTYRINGRLTLTYADTFGESIRLMLDILFGAK